MAAGRIILLNGSSSAGKTTLAITLQQLLPRSVAPHRARSVSRRYGRPLSRPELTARHTRCAWSERSAGLRTATNASPRCSSAISASRCCAACVERSQRSRREGNNVIIDDLMFEPEFLFDYVEALAGFEVLFVGVRCPIDVVNAREAKRPGRFPGYGDVALRSWCTNTAFTTSKSIPAPQRRDSAPNRSLRAWMTAKPRTHSTGCAPSRSRFRSALSLQSTARSIDGEEPCWISTSRRRRTAGRSRSCSRSADSSIASSR